MRRKHICARCEHVSVFKEEKAVRGVRDLINDGWAKYGKKWLCWPCSMDKMNEGITPKQRAALKQKWKKLNDERLQLVHLKFSTGRDPEEDERYHLVCWDMDRLDPIVFRLNTDYFREQQKWIRDSDALIKKMNKTLKAAGLDPVGVTNGTDGKVGTRSLEHAGLRRDGVRRSAATGPRPDALQPVGACDAPGVPTGDAALVDRRRKVPVPHAAQGRGSRRGAR